jgi:hypothetical protein
MFSSLPLLYPTSQPGSLAQQKNLQVQMLTLRLQ